MAGLPPRRPLRQVVQDIRNIDNEINNIGNKFDYLLIGVPSFMVLCFIISYYPNKMTKVIFTIILLLSPLMALLIRNLKGYIIRRLQQRRREFYDELLR